jgi:uncharacterized protein (DUF433 family)
MILEKLSYGESIEQILEAYPQLTQGTILLHLILPQKF